MMLQPTRICLMARVLTEAIIVRAETTRSECKFSCIPTQRHTGGINESERCKLDSFKKLRCKVDWISLQRRRQIRYYFDLLPAWLPSLVQTIRYTVRLLTHVHSKPTHFVFHSFKADMSYFLQTNFVSVMKDWAINTMYGVPPQGHLQGQTRDNSNTRFFTLKRNTQTCVLI